ncbi:MAG: phosphoribosylglycinamide formyltransferase [Treponema sp.]|nr:phosphoribosylglycinamide formyltransferase [Treponema sp.]
MNKKVNVSVLVSGGGTNLQALIDYEKSHAECPYKITAVISSTKNAYALERAQNAGIETFIKSPWSVMGKDKAQGASREEKNLSVSNAIMALCDEVKTDVIVLAGYLSVLCGDIIKKYEGRIINLHPALLPKFGGVGMWGHNVHEAVLAAGEKESGCTVHLVDSGCDTGKILVQKKVPVLPGDTVDSLYARIAPKEHEAIVEGLLKLCGAQF